MLLLKIWGFTVKEISSRIDIPEKTIYTRLNRLKKKIKKVLKV
ncbi:sigma factor-like helix-turn-helix DNA-binding protein [[Clostridium] scindens]